MTEREGGGGQASVAWWHLAFACREPLGGERKTVTGRVLVPGSDIAFGGEPVDVALSGEPRLRDVSQ